nr:hypothetical protein [uncultured Stomatobaculum sp.]
MNSNRTVQRKPLRRGGRQFAALILGASLALNLPVAVQAEVTSGVHPTVDEAYYVTLDSYGNPTDAAVVKSYALNGATEIVDHGTYDSVENLTNGVKPEINGDTVRFSLGEGAPSHFYFEGKTRAPFETLPFQISIQYLLNGVPTDAAKLAGEKGVVEMHIRAVPNPASSEYQKNNWFLTAAAVFNQNDILSLTAPDAQIQTVGNLKTALFVWLPGESQEYVLSVGAEDFKFDGFTFLLGPVNASGRLGDLKKLQDDKQDVQKSWDSLNAASDRLFDAAEGMQGKLNQAANGLDGLNQVRKNVQSRESEFYGNLDNFLGNMDGLDSALAPASGHLNSANQTVGELHDNLSAVNESLLTLQRHLKESESTLSALQNNMESFQDASDDLDSDSRNIKNDLRTLRSLSEAGKTGANQKISGTLQQMSALYQGYAQYMQAHGLQPVDAGGTGSNRIRIRATNLGTTSNAGGIDYTADAELTPSPQYPQGSFQDFAVQKLASLGYDSEQIAYALALWNQRDTVQAAAAGANEVYGKIDALGNDLDALRLSSLYDALYGSSATGSLAASDVKKLSADIRQSIDALDRVYRTADGYLPALQATLGDAATLSDTVRADTESLTALLRTSRDIVKSNSPAFHRSADLALDASASILRQSASALDSTDAMRQAADSIRDLVDQKWNENTGEKTRLFSLDAAAAPESLTSSENADVSSVSVMLRSAEIKTAAPDSHVKGATGQKKTGLFSRIRKMFADIWHDLTGWMHR